MACQKLGNLLGIVGRWVGKNPLSLLLIFAVLVAPGFIQKEIEAYLLTRDAVVAMNLGKALLDAFKRAARPSLCWRGSAGTLTVWPAVCTGTRIA